MIEKHPLCPERLRKISGSFAFIEHRFLREGFWATLSPKGTRSQGVQSGKQ